MRMQKAGNGENGANGHGKLAGMILDELTGKPKRGRPSKAMLEARALAAKEAAGAGAPEVLELPAKKRGRAPVEAPAIIGISKRIEIPAPQVGVLNVPIVGDTSLITHAWSVKVRDAIEAKHQGKAATKRAPKNPEEEYRASLYVLPAKRGQKERYGFPAAGFKQAAVSACRFAGNMPMTLARGAFFVLGDLVEIVGKPHMRFDMVRVGTGLRKSIDTRYRGEFDEWSATLQVRYSRNVISEEQIFNLFAHAGLHIGVGEWRPEKAGGGSHGMFHVG